MSAHLQKASGAPNKEEVNQFSLLHLASVYEWQSQKLLKRAPNKSRVAAAAGEFRQVEYQSALRFVSTLKQPPTQRERELRSFAHDVMTPDHDRQFRELAAFLPTALLRNEGGALRIFDIGEIDDNVRVSAHAYGNDHQLSIEHDMTQFVWNGHMRCLFPTAVTTPDNWKTWANNAGPVFNYACNSWSVD